MSVYYDQRILVAIGLEGRGVILGYRGDGVHGACDDGGLLDARDIFPAQGYPETPGLYLWRGTIEISVWDDDWDFDISLKGEWAPATDEQVIDLIGVQEPRPVPVEAD